MRRGLLALLSLLVAGCGERNVYAPEDVDVLVVDAVLLVGERFPTLYLSRTTDPREPANVQSRAERGATVTIQWTDEQSQLITYVESPDTPGAYLSPGGVEVVQPEIRYRLEVRTRSGETLTAETVTPAALHVDEWVLLDETTLEPVRSLSAFEDVGEQVFEDNQIVYSRGLLEARFNRPDVVAFQVGLFSLDAGSDPVIDPEFFDDEDFADLERVISTPVLLVEDGRLRLPWFAIYFEGRYWIKVFAIDRNWFDLARTVPDFGQSGSGFGGNAGDGFQRPIFHVEGGIGLFGSGSLSANGFTILPTP